MLRTGRSQLQIDRLGGDLSMKAVRDLRQSDLNTPSFCVLETFPTLQSDHLCDVCDSLLVFSAMCGPMEPGDQVGNICLLRPGISSVICATRCAKAGLRS